VARRRISCSWYFHWAPVNAVWRPPPRRHRGIYHARQGRPTLYTSDKSPNYYNSIAFLFCIPLYHIMEGYLYLRKLVGVLPPVPVFYILSLSPAADIPAKRRRAIPLLPQHRNVGDFEESLQAHCAPPRAGSTGRPKPAHVAADTTANTAVGRRGSRGRHSRNLGKIRGGQEIRERRAKFPFANFPNDTGGEERRLMDIY